MYHKSVSARRSSSLEFRFGAFEAIACAALELARKDPDDKLPMDVRTAAAILEFGDDLREASRAAAAWLCEHRACEGGVDDQSLQVHARNRGEFLSRPGGSS